MRKAHPPVLFFLEEGTRGEREAKKEKQGGGEKNETKGEMISQKKHNERGGEERQGQEECRKRREGKGVMSCCLDEQTRVSEGEKDIRERCGN